MSDIPTPVTHAVDAEGIGWIIFDNPAARANLFSPGTLAALRAALLALGAEPVRAVVVLSGKEKIFIAGADLHWLAGLADARSATQVAREGQELFGLLAGFKVPVVCAIHGACAGGGFELALACTWRIASEARETVIGLPEVGVGLIPGWGGCVRLPALIGAQAAVEHLLKAALVPAAEARRAGLVDELAPAADLKERARAAAWRLVGGDRPARPAPPAVAPGFFADRRQQALIRRRGQPAPLAMLDVVEQSAGLPLASALDLEAVLFGGVAAGEVAKNLIHIFFLKEAARKLTVDAWYPPAAVAPGRPYRTIGIVGAGVMGSGIAYWCALHGYGVILCDSNRGAIERGVVVIRGLFAEAVQRGKVTGEQAHRMTGGIGITTSMEDFEICDLVIEAITEDLGAKQKLFAELSRAAGPDCLLASNTSALPLEELAAAAENPGRFVGLHFFNPVSRMPLVELVLGAQTTRATAERALAFVQTLGKSAILCQSSPGFFVTRVLGFYLNEACRLWEQGVPAEVIDGAMREWGWPMGPLRLIDEVGVDVIESVSGEMGHYFPGRFTGAAITGRLLAAGFTGRKNDGGAGFYAGETLNPALANFASGPTLAMEFKAIQDRLNGVLVAETRRALAEGVIRSADDADLALLLGAGFPAFRGGLMRQAHL